MDPSAWAVAVKVAAALKALLDNQYAMQDHPPVIIRTVQSGARRLELYAARGTVAEKIGNNKLRGALVECEDTEAAVQRLARVLNERAAPNDYHRFETALRKPAGGPRYGASHRRPAAGDRARESVCLDAELVA